MKYSKQRELILDAIRSNPVHPTADYVYNTVKKSTNISLSTVYRNLNQLVDAGIIRKIEVSGMADCFDAVMDEHQHVICESCGKVRDIEIDIDDEMKKTIWMETDIQITSVNIVFKGICNDCKSNYKQ